MPPGCLTGVISPSGPTYRIGRLARGPAVFAEGRWLGVYGALRFVRVLPSVSCRSASSQSSISRPCCPPRARNNSYARRATSSYVSFILDAPPLLAEFVANPPRRGHL